MRHKDKDEELSLKDEPDRLEKGIRFGCGTMIGILIALKLTYRILIDHSGFLAATCIIALVCGLLAVKYGDRFWDTVIEFLNPWRHWR